MAAGTELLQDVTMRRRIDDEERLQVLAECRIVDTPQDAEYEAAAEAMHLYCQVPIAAISFADGDRMWMKAQRGCSVKVISRESSFCSVCMHDSRPLCVEDTLRDARFSRNELVTNRPYIRFYLGYPIFSWEGYGLGSVCVIDTIPRTLAARQTALLEQTRDWVQASVHSRRLRRLLEEESQGTTLLNVNRANVEFAERRTERAWESVQRMMRFLEEMPLKRA